MSTIQRWTKGASAEIDAASPAVDSSLSPGCRLRWSSASATTAAVVKRLMTEMSWHSFSMQRPSVPGALNSVWSVSHAQS